ncbi:hypothetical protein CEXT_532941 [Caerostris extrusa]|uniref:Uncharacterized protein n=1 Tax=Caerostris extrusa TaxID=172846 RepID=A0AAV4PM37_CAEEX|nr:hypothetical protein CEXT_532941 [Caerostris extrusa]
MGEKTNGKRGKLTSRASEEELSVDNSSATFSRVVYEGKNRRVTAECLREGGSWYGLLIKIVQNGSGGKKYITWNKQERHWKFLLAIKVRDDVGNSEKSFPYSSDPGNLFVKRLKTSS